MKATHRVSMLIAPAFFALSACGIPATGVVEAGGPASGIVPTTPMFFVRDGTLVAVPRVTARPGDAGAALQMLLIGPTQVEAHGGLATEVPGAPAEVPGAPAEVPGAPAEVPGAPTAAALAPTSASRAPEQTSPDGPTVSVKGDTLSIRLPSGFGELSPLATSQLICTAAAAHRIGHPSGGAVTVTVSDGSGWHAEGTDENCPDP
ncbi:hypothetical protein ACFYM5_26860 [Streptomyces sp. NPDC006706]|uniref:hypothetical protein n=1 Tax=Streptomyces sp. NPDC006706 TaxID=3364761 RepID=UPI0036AB877C